MIGVAIDLFRQPFQHDYTNDRHKDVIKKLKFIGKIDSGDRINVNNISTTSSTSWFSSIYRSIFKESRSKTYQFLNDVIDRSFELITIYQDSRKMSDRITCSHIVEDLHHSIHGLKNLQTTYIEDISFSCDIDTLIGSIYARLAECYQNEKVLLSEEQRHRLQHILFPKNEPVVTSDSNQPIIIPNRIVQDSSPVLSSITTTPPLSLDHSPPDAIFERDVQSIQTTKEECIEKEITPPKPNKKK